jgi:hypothetical protein
VKASIAMAFAIALAQLGGCASVPPAEIAFQVVHAVDTAQTVQISREPARFQETNALMGAHPTTARVLEWGVTVAAVHLLVSDFLRAHDMPKLYAAWQIVTIGIASRDVANNYRFGIRLGF